MNQATDYRKPDYRGVFHDSVLTLVRYLDWMPSAFGFARPLIRDNSRATLADFEIVRDLDGLELIVTELTVPSGDEFRDAVIHFARPLGYRRVWMPHEVIDLDPFVEAADLVASTTCPACQSVFGEDAPEFIMSARLQGVWPPVCPLDGFPLPQWQLVDRQEAMAVAK